MAAKTEWSAVGSVDPKALVAARLELHWAAQIASAAGATLLPPKPDDSHTNLGWDAAARALVGHAIGGRRAGLRFDDLAIFVQREDGRVVAEERLAGKTLAEGIAWLGEALKAKLARPVHELPSHPVASGGRFGGQDAPGHAPGHAPGRAELARWFGNAAVALAPIVGRDPSASPVRCWPHHFDLGTVLTIEPSRTVGVGFSPGDASYEEPYFYVTPWPYPKAGTALPALPAGHWHTEGWTGAILPATAIVASARSEALVTDWLDAAVAAARRLVG